MSKKLGFGHRYWAIADGYIPGWSSGPEPELRSHETLCFLNTSDVDANVSVYIYYSEREPSGPYQIKVPARRTLHQKINDLKDPQPVAHKTDYACFIESDTPIVVQHTRLDSRKSENALISTIAFHSD
jgi:hypothetical protein